MRRLRPAGGQRAGATTASGLAPLGIAIALAAGCGGGRSAGPPQIPPVPVMVAEALRKDIPLELRSIGRVESYSTVEVRSQVDGVLQTVNFKEGQTVQKGQLLFTMDKRPFAASLSQAEAQLASDRALSRNAEADVARYEGLAKKNKDWVTGQQMAQVGAAADAAGERAKADEAIVEMARLRLSYCTITAPIPGRVGTILVHAGNAIKANDAPMVVLLQTRPTYVTFSAPEKYLPLIQRRRTGETLVVSASPPQSDDAPHVGRLTFLDNTVNISTGTIQLKAEFPNEDEALWPGQFVEVILTLESQKGAVVVPSQAVQTGQQGDYVFVLKADGTVESRPITVAREYMAQAIVETGINPGEKVVTDGQLRLVPGTKVDVKEALAKPAEKSS